MINKNFILRNLYILNIFDLECFDDLRFFFQYQREGLIWTVIQLQSVIILKNEELSAENREELILAVRVFMDLSVLIIKLMATVVQKIHLRPIVVHSQN